MALGGGEVDEPAVGEQVDPAAVRERELLDELARLARLGRERAQRRDLDLDVEVARVGEDRAVLHRARCARAAITCLSPVAVQKMSPILAACVHRHHLEAVHHGLERRHRVDLGDDHVRAHARAPASRRRGRTSRSRRRRSVAPGEQDVRGADDPVDRRLARAVAVVEQVLRLRVVDGDDREAELAVALERLQPDDAGRRLLGAGDDVAELLAPGRVEDADHVGAVVHRQLRLVVDRGLDVRVVGVVVLALDRERRRCRTRRRAPRRRRPASRAGSRRRARRRRRPPSACASGSPSRSSRAGRPRRGSRRAAARARSARGSRRSTGICRSAHSIRRTPSGGEREVLHVVSLRRCHLMPSLSCRCRQAASSRSCLRCSHSSASRASAPASQASTAARSAGSRRSRDANATSESSIPKRAAAARAASGAGSARGGRRGGSRLPSAAGRRAPRARDSGASAATSRSAQPPRRP